VSLRHGMLQVRCTLQDCRAKQRVDLVLTSVLRLCVSRKNPQHFAEFSHPKGHPAADAARAALTAAAPPTYPPTSLASPAVQIGGAGAASAASSSSASLASLFGVAANPPPLSAAQQAAIAKYEAEVTALSQAAAAPTLPPLPTAAAADRVIEEWKSKVDPVLELTRNWPLPGITSADAFLFHPLY
jgi:hypothetical protein